jgi:hypothetical protein
LAANIAAKKAKAQADIVDLARATESAKDAGMKWVNFGSAVTAGAGSGALIGTGIGTIVGAVGGAGIGSVPASGVGAIIGTAAGALTGIITGAIAAGYDNISTKREE